MNADPRSLSSFRRFRRLPAAVCASIAVAVATLGAGQAPAAPRFSVLAFYTGTRDKAHVSFVGEANRWFPETARANGFAYEATTDWSRLTDDSLSRQQVLLFLDTRPDDPAQREAFRATWRKAARGWDSISPASP